MEDNDSFIPGDNQTDFGKIISIHELSYLERIVPTIPLVLGCFILAIGVLGIVGNILNLIVFIKLGFVETINLSFMALAISDLGVLITLMGVTLTIATPVVKSLLAWYRIQTDMTDFGNFTFALPSLAFTRTTAMVTAYISLERCLSVLFPTKIKLILTPRRTKIVLITIYLIGCCFVTIAYVGWQIDLIFDPVSNYNILVLTLKDETGGIKSAGLLRSVFFFLYGAIYPLTSSISVTVCTAYMIFKLKQSSKWRNVATQGITTGTRPRRAMYRRERRVQRTVISIASAFIILTLPVSISVFVALVEPEYSQRGSLKMWYIIHRFVALMLLQVNSSCNFIIYTLTGSKFRSTLFRLVPRKCCTV